MPAKTRNVLNACSDYYGPFYKDGENTGAFFLELLHPYLVFRDACFNVDIVTESGKIQFDDHSVAGPAIDKGSKGEEFLSYDDHIASGPELSKAEKYVLENKDDMFWRIVQNSKTADEVNPDKYDIFFVAGGHATLFDFPKATNLQKLGTSIYENGGVVAAVCHGPTLLPFMKRQTSDGSVSIVCGKDVTAFDRVAEDKSKLMEALKKYNLEVLDDMLNDAGANFIKSPNPFGDFVIADGRLVTGSNPASATSTAKTALRVL